MQTKLTLRLDQKLIHRAKIFAKSTGKSISQLVADYFALLEEGEKKDNLQMTPIVRSLKGALREADISIEDYHRHLEEKHL